MVSALIIPTLQQTEAHSWKQYSWNWKPSSLAPEFGVSTTVVLGILVYISKTPSQDFHFVSFNPPAHLTFFTSGHSSLFPEHSMYFHTTVLLFMLLALSRTPSSSSPLRKLLFVLQNPVQCHLFSEACPTPILDRMIYSLPSGPIVSCLHYTIS